MVTSDVVRKRIQSMSDFELLDRLMAKNFTEEAMNIALAEVAVRGLDDVNVASQYVANYEREEAEQLETARDERFRKFFSKAIVLAGTIGFLKTGFIPVAIVGAILWPLSHNFTSFLCAKIKYRFECGFILTVIVVVLTMISIVTGASISKYQVGGL